MKTKLIPKCQAGKDGLQPTNLTAWNSDSVAKYMKLHPFQITNFSKLNNNLLFSEKLDNKEKREQGRTRLSEDAETTLNTSGNNCLGSTLNWNSNKIAPLFGVTPFRKTIQDFWLPGYKHGTFQMEEYDDNGKFEKGKFHSSWNFARLYSDAGYGRMVKYDPKASYPIGTIFSIGNASGVYIPKKYDKDEYNNPYPAHSYTLTGFDIDKNGNQIPIYYDFGGIGYGKQRLYPNKEATYAFIPYGYEHLTAENIVPKYMKWKQEVNNTQNIPYIQGQDAANNQFLKGISQKDLQALTEYYGFGASEEILKRLMAIGTQESRLGYSLEGDAYDSSKFRRAKYKAPGLIKSVGKALETGVYAVDPSKYDKKAGYEHEIDIFNQLLSTGKLQGLNKQQIRQLVAQKYNKEAKKFGSNYGKKRPTFEITNNSSGAFQLKDAPQIMSNFRDINGKLIKIGSSDDIYPGDNETLKAYNRFLYNMQLLKKKYPDLTDSQLIDAATISWNAPSKLRNEDFINLYIKDQILQDNYLQKVIDYQNSLYGRN